MAWLRVGLVVRGDQAEALGDALEARGALSIDLADADAGSEREAPRFAEPGACTAMWPRCRVSALLAEDTDADALLAAALLDAGADSLAAASIERVEDTDWVARTQREFAPIRAGERLWIVPSWHEAPDAAAVNVVLDPGAAFGTGSHPTTRLCLAWLEKNVRGGDTVLDYGCGSGILAIAALKLGAAAAIATDIDPAALEAARYNAKRNAVPLEVLDAQLPIDATASITVANILANPLRMLAPVLAAHTRRGGRIALCGILASQAAEVADAYSRWTRLEVAGARDDWVLLAGRIPA